MTYSSRTGKIMEECMPEAYSPEECELMSRALTEAWQHLSETRQSENEGLEKAALTHAILKAADLGERSISVLAAYALAHLEQAKREIQDRVDLRPA